ncbi:MAG: bifunctional glutamate N-acetyltransferase/amino-acid acetyltransferase ArgJ [Roseburia sp.]|nr:bifunctional glutamate N-acetyltransferase/amino-acid acetyltransferase ArgJ [Ruminococcus sp.]MCM1156033.1 bifunctional glutamate N-acetyltransferase/amino-acid acetyltransferase ArgJ [Roseburia sp.]MCM1243942.1 bifunctional glutamate N-acetyltransferase/amino-acid acetyltransferase ArgJ [Roseburia sp.]
MNIIEGGVTAAAGFEAAGVEAGIKYQNRKDMALIYSKAPCKAAGVFTSNMVKAAPVIWDKEIVTHSPYAQAVVINAGIANACTGAEGYDCCKKTAQAAAECLQIPEDAVCVASTGVIGMQLPVDKITAGVKLLAGQKQDTIEAGRLAAEAIMTTDTVSKQAAATIEIGGKTVTLGGMCKGSGMIHPNMSTMLCFITSDIAISKELLQAALSEDVKDTFNMISVDGDTSTNDTLIVLANGMAGNPEVTTRNEDYDKFRQALHYINETLAKMMAGDGEGATALFEAKVIHAKTKEDARVLSRSVISSNLTKAAIFGHDANMGRAFCALGYSGVVFDADIVDIYLENEEKSLQVYQNGMMLSYSEEEATKILSSPEVRILADMKAGDAEAAAWGCDLTYEYVKINADYRS